MFSQAAPMQQNRWVDLGFIIIHLALACGIRSDWLHCCCICFIPRCLCQIWERTLLLGLFQRQQLLPRPLGCSCAEHYWKGKIYKFQMFQGHECNGKYSCAQRENMGKLLLRLVYKPSLQNFLRKSSLCRSGFVESCPNALFTFSLSCFILFFLLSSSLLMFPLSDIIFSGFSPWFTTLIVRVYMCRMPRHTWCTARICFNAASQLIAKNTHRFCCSVHKDNKMI